MPNLMNDTRNYVQEMWKEGRLVGMDCILYGNGKVIVGNTYVTIDAETKTKKRHWTALCDTDVQGLEKYSPDIWTPVGIYGSTILLNDQVIVFGEGSMGNEGFVASIEKTGLLNWGVFFTFSNPICEIEVYGNELRCISDKNIHIRMQFDNLININVDIMD